jgi:hypothetical protein
LSSFFARQLENDRVGDARRAAAGEHVGDVRSELVAHEAG